MTGRLSACTRMNSISTVDRGLRQIAGLLALTLFFACWTVPGFASAGMSPSGQSGVGGLPHFDGQPITHLKRGRRVKMYFDKNTAVANFPAGAERYHRFMIDHGADKVRISIGVLTLKHDAEPRFTVFSPNLVLLDDGGQIRRIVPLKHLQLDIRPFRPTRLSQCVVVGGVKSFLLTSDSSRLGELYQFDASPDADGHPDHGFFRDSSPMQVFLTYVDSGPVQVEVTPAPEQGSACLSVPDESASS